MEALYFIVLLIFVSANGKRSPIIILCAIYAVSILLGYLIGNESRIDTEVGILTRVLNLAIITGFIYPWSKFTYDSKVENDCLGGLINTLVAINLLVFIVNIICLYYGFSEIEDYTSVKNGDGGDYLYKLIPINTNFITICSYLSPSSIFLIPIGLEQLKNGKKGKALICFLLSTNIITTGLIGFSRSAFINYLLIFCFYLPFVYKKFNVDTRKFLVKIIFISLLVLSSVFYIITKNRFGNDAYYNDVDNLNIKNPLLYSIIDYTSQWYPNSLNAIQMFNNGDFDILYGRLSFPLQYYILDKLNILEVNISVDDLLYRVFGTMFDRFNGLAANLLVDLGYIGTLLLIVVYNVAIGILAKASNGVMSKKVYLTIGVLFLIPSTGIFNLELKSSYYHVALIYAILIWLYLIAISNSLKTNRLVK